MRIPAKEDRVFRDLISFQQERWFFCGRGLINGHVLLVQSL